VNPARYHKGNRRYVLRLNVGFRAVELHLLERELQDQLQCLGRKTLPAVRRANEISNTSTSQ